jgi:hypothetical protein
MSCKRWAVVGAGLAMLGMARAGRAADVFVTPKPEELAMISAPGFPGAPAVVLYREEVTQDQGANLSSVVVEDAPAKTYYYSRIKILKEDGRKYANVEIWDTGRTNTVVEDVVGRTIHADGTIVPFTGKPFFKLVEDKRGTGTSLQETIFTLPAVEVGSVIEYSYTTHEAKWVVRPPYWVLQDSLPVLLAHYEWRPTMGVQDANGTNLHAISWYPVLPAGVKVEKQTTGYAGVYTSTKDRSYDCYAVTVKDVPALEDGEDLPPIWTRRYGVRFAYASSAGEDFWRSEGKMWSKDRDRFMDVNGDMRKAAAQLVAGASTEEEKARRIYAAVMAMENTDYTRARETVEEKAEGNKAVINNAGDILARKRGTSMELTDVFVALSRGAGLEAYLMAVPDGSQDVFSPAWLSMDQFDAFLAIVNIDGKERFLDPGTKACPFGQLAWWHAQMQGIRQGAGGTSIATAPAQSYRDNQTGRLANLSLDAAGELSGKIDLVYTGARALEWRHVGLRNDELELNKQLGDTLQAMVPETLNVQVTGISGLAEYEQPLKVSVAVTGTLGTVAGKRRVVPADLFVSRLTTPFPERSRQLAVYLRYPEAVQDAVRIVLPAGWTVEASPDAAKLELPQRALYDLGVTAAAGSFTTRRHSVEGVSFVPAAEYAAVRDFFGKRTAADQGSVVLKAQ